MDFKKISKKFINLPNVENVVKDSLLFSLKNTKVKSVNFQYKEEKEEDVVEPANSERLIRIRKPRETITRDKEPKVTDVVFKKKERRSLRRDVVLDKSDDVSTKKKVKLQKSEQPQSIIKEIKELSPEVIQAKTDLANLKKTFAKLLLPVKWSRKSVSVDSEE